MNPNTVTTGLDRLLSDDNLLSRYRGLQVGLLANQATVTADLEHAIDALIERGVTIRRLFGPEHGLRGFAQDMEAVAENRDPITGIPVVSLYGDDYESLAPPLSSVEDLDCLFLDVPDIGTRYYTFAASALFVAKRATQANTQVVVLDRPNPIGGSQVEGNLVELGYDSFVGALSVANRHGMTLAELLDYARRFDGQDLEFDTLQATGWDRGMWADETGLPWVLPSPNMPTLDTAIIYPGMCLLEATNLSEGRGTTRPFELFGAPYIDGQLLTRRLNELMLPGVRFRSAVFKPGFQKWAGEACFGCQVHITDRNKCRPYQLGLAILSTVYRLFQDDFDWRLQPYEFVTEKPAIDLLCGTDRPRVALEGGADWQAVCQEAVRGQDEFEHRRHSVLRYP